MALKFFLDSSQTKILFTRLDIACKYALASGHDVGIQGRALKCFPMGHHHHPDGFDCFEADMVLPKERFSKFLSETWFSYRDAKDRGLIVLLDCEKGTIAPVEDDLADDASVIEQSLRPLYEIGLD